MHTQLLLDIIQKGVEELKQITDSFKTETPNAKEIDIVTSKTETLLKELQLLKTKETNHNYNISIKEETNIPSSYINTEKDLIEKTDIPHSDTDTIAKDKVIGETISTSPDLNNLININDKFQFSMELFNNDMDIYKKTIDKLNSVSTFENAKKIISSFDWNEENETVLHFYEILTRKFNYNV